jgi:hypothetical protein
VQIAICLLYWYKSPNTDAEGAEDHNADLQNVPHVHTRRTHVYYIMSIYLLKNKTTLFRRVLPRLPDAIRQRKLIPSES